MCTVPRFTNKTKRDFFELIKDDVSAMGKVIYIIYGGSLDKAYFLEMILQQGVLSWNI